MQPVTNFRHLVIGEIGTICRVTFRSAITGQVGTFRIQSHHGADPIIIIHMSSLFGFASKFAFTCPRPKPRTFPSVTFAVQISLCTSSHLQIKLRRLKLANEIPLKLANDVPRMTYAVTHTVTCAVTHAVTRAVTHSATHPADLHRGSGARHPRVLRRRPARRVGGRVRPLVPVPARAGLHHRRRRPPLQPVPRPVPAARLARPARRLSAAAASPPLLPHELSLSLSL